MHSQYTYLNQTQLGEIFGVSSHKIGKWLIACGLRTPNRKPTREAFDGDYVSTSHNGRDTGWFYVWHREKTVAALIEAGHEPVNLEVAG